MTLTGLATWGVVHKVRKPGRRGDLYEAETDFWKMISKVLAERERLEIEAAIHTVSRALAHAKAARHGATGQNRKDVAFLLGRLQQLDRLSRIGNTLLDMLLGELSLDIGRFRDVFRGGQRRSPQASKD